MSLLSAKFALRLAGPRLTRPLAVPVFSRTTALSFRTFLTTASVHLPTTKAKPKVKAKDADKPKTKGTRAKKVPAVKKKATPIERVKKVNVKPKCMYDFIPLPLQSIIHPLSKLSQSTEN